MPPAPTTVICKFGEDFSAVRQDETVENTIQLVILEQPTEKFRFRYASEMRGTHGSLNGEHSKKNKKTFPEVELKGFDGNGIIRCSLYQTTVDSLHPHKLVVLRDEVDECDPHDLHVSPEQGYIACFQNMGIIHTARKNICEMLFAKKAQEMKFETGSKELSREQEKELREEAHLEGKSIDLNEVRLCFEAFAITNGGDWQRICEPVYSRPISNLQSASTGKLKICRLSSAVSSANGGEDLILLVEKVNKNVQVRFYEVRRGVRVWEAIMDTYVHHQYAILVSTPPYLNKDIESRVDVFIELVRNNERSASVSFVYKPRDIVMTRKRKRPTTSRASTVPPLISKLSNSAYNVPQAIQQPNFHAPTTTKRIGYDAPHERKNEFMEKVEEDLHQLRGNVGDVNSVFDLIDGIELDGATQVIPSAKQKQKFSAPTKNMKSDASIHQIIKQIKGILCDGANMTQGRRKIRKILADYSADNGDTIIHDIIKLGLYRDARTLFNSLEILQLTGVLSQTNNLSQTPLHYACIFHRHMFIRLLLQLNCNSNVQDNKANTALHVAANEGCAECLSQFVHCMAAKANIRLDANLANDDGFTPLHLAIQQNNINYVRTLLSKFNASAKTAISRNGNNALHLAVQYHNSEIVKFILENSDVELNAKNWFGHTAIDLAKTLYEKGRRNILDLLMEKPSMASEDDFNLMSDDEPEDDYSTEDEDDKSDSSVEDPARQRQGDKSRRFTEDRIDESYNIPSLCCKINRFSMNCRDSDHRRQMEETRRRIETGSPALYVAQCKGNA